MPISAHRPLQAGMSLIELMVGMLVGLIGIIIISQMYITNEQYKRSTTGAGSAQVNGAVALYTLERDIRMSGYGINHSAALGCSCDTATKPGCSPLQYYYNGSYSYPPAGGAVGALQPLTIAPALIRQTADQPDTLTLLYGSDSERVTPSKLLQTMSPPNYEFTSDGTAGFEDGNMVLVTQGEACALAQVTVNATNSLLAHGTGSYNPPANGSLPVFARDSSIFNLGTPIWRRYQILNSKLVVTDLLKELAGDADATQELVDDVIDLQAQYGHDTNNDTIRKVDTYNKDTPGTADGWMQVYAVRIAVLARSQNYEKSDEPGLCKATTVDNQPRWGKTAADPVGLKFPVLNATLTADFKGEAGCYKYRVFETVVPLRNMLWR